MRTHFKFTALDENFRQTYKKILRETAFTPYRVSVAIEGLKNHEDIYPMVEITNRNVMYYSPELQENVNITNKIINAEIRINI